MKELENRHTFERWPVIEKGCEGEILPPEKKVDKLDNDKERINLVLNLIHAETSNKTTINPTHITYITHVENRERDMWEQIGEDMAGVAIFVGPPLIRGAKYLYNQYRKRRSIKTAPVPFFS